jgi:hypothetical protein
MGDPRKPLKQADPQPVATHGNGFGAHGKEGVDGSSPSEGSAKVQHAVAFAFGLTCRVGSVRWVWSCLWSFRVQNLALRAAHPAAVAAPAGGAALHVDRLKTRCVTSRLFVECERRSICE